MLHHIAPQKIAFCGRRLRAVVKTASVCARIAEYAQLAIGGVLCHANCHLFGFAFAVAKLKSNGVARHRCRGR